MQHVILTTFIAENVVFWGAVNIPEGAGVDITLTYGMMKK